MTGMNNAGLSCRETGRQLGRNHIVILVDFYENTNKPKMSMTGTGQKNLVIHLHEKTERHYDLFDVTHFPAARS